MVQRIYGDGVAKFRFMRVYSLRWQHVEPGWMRHFLHILLMSLQNCLPIGIELMRGHLSAAED